MALCNPMGLFICPVCPDPSVSPSMRVAPALAHYRLSPERTGQTGQHQMGPSRPGGVAGDAEPRLVSPYRIFGSEIPV